MISSAIPSQKYSCSGSALMFLNGKTAIDGTLDGFDSGTVDVFAADKSSRRSATAL